jgi:hypothetical protein|tara:strand:- start:545 stop:694 length:150 start_codon:yes stop_codon:yes gene_type:complete
MSEFQKVIENMDSEAFIKLFDFGTDSEFKPDQEVENMSDEDLLKELGVK